MEQDGHFKNICIYTYIYIYIYIYKVALILPLFIIYKGTSQILVSSKIN